MVLKSDDGSPLIAKDPIVLGPNGEEIQIASSASSDQDRAEYGYSAQRTRVFQLKGWWVILGILALIPFLFLGAAFVAFLFVTALILWALRTLFRALSI